MTNRPASKTCLLCKFFQWDTPSKITAVCRLKEQPKPTKPLQTCREWTLGIKKEEQNV